MRKVYVDVKLSLVIRADEDSNFEEIMNELDYNFQDTTGKANVEDMEIRDYDIIDSK